LNGPKSTWNLLKKNNISLPARQVKHPGTYDYPSKQYLLDVLALAGGLTEKAGQEVHVRKLGDGSGGLQQAYVIDIEELINEGRTDLNISINGGDVIFVPEAGLFFVDGAVRSPGQYHIKSKLNLNEAIINAGGLLSYADKKEIILLRRTDEGPREEIKIDIVKNPHESDELIVKDGDIIFVGAGFWAKFISGGGINIGIPGLGGFSYRDPERRY
jgi:polysaccharide export outer membrane protein